MFTSIQVQSNYSVSLLCSNFKNTITYIVLDIVLVFTVKFDLLLNGYFPIALTQDELLEGDWEYMATDSDLNVDFYSYGNDPRVSIGFDTYGNIAGVRVSVCGFI